MNRTALVRIAFLLLALFMAFVFLMLIAYKADAHTNADDIGWPNGYSRITKVYSDQMTYDVMWLVPDSAGYTCIITGKFECVTGGQVEKVGTDCLKVGNQKLQCEFQDLRWRETYKSACNMYLPISSKSCVCDGHKNGVSKNGKFLFGLDLLPNGNVKDGVVNLTIDDSVSVAHTWNGGDPKNDPCFDKVEVKVKIEGNPEPKYASCNDSLTCVYSASMIGSDKYATVTDKVYFKDGSSCYASWDNFDPDSNDDPIVPGE